MRSHFQRVVLVLSLGTFVVSGLSGCSGKPEGQQQNQQSIQQQSLPPQQQQQQQQQQVPKK